MSPYRKHSQGDNPRLRGNRRSLTMSLQDTIHDSMLRVANSATTLACAMNRELDKGASPNQVLAFFLEQMKDIPGSSDYIETVLEGVVEWRKLLPPVNDGNG